MPLSFVLYCSPKTQYKFVSVVSAEICDKARGALTWIVATLPVKIGLKSRSNFLIRSRISFSVLINLVPAVESNHQATPAPSGFSFCGYSQTD